MNKIKRSIRFFNTTGPCNPWDHYMLPPEDRLVGAQLHRYIRDNLYWVLHAPRQTGKTTFLRNWAREINEKREAVACYVSIESCQGINERAEAMRTMHFAICESARAWELPIPELSLENPELLLYKTMRKWSELVIPKPLIVLFDEIDVLEGDVLIGFLRQLRDGFTERGIGKFPISISLVGMRDLKDYITQSKDGVPVNPGSPFNVKADSATIDNFSMDNIYHLFTQRTEETGQEITKEALDYLWDQSRGQPWIVNALLQRATMRILDETSTETITLSHIKEAREQMVLARETHLDALAYRMENPNIKKMMETLFIGDVDMDMANGEAFRLCMDLGLVHLEKGIPSIANPIYREVLARQITFGPQVMIPEPEWQWEKPDGSLDMDALLKEFQVFWRENSEIWEEKMNYTEAFPHLLLMAFLQRVLNGGGYIDREYAAGRGRMDLFIEYKDKSFIIEIKLIHEKQFPDTIKAKGLEQIAKYRNIKAPDAPAYLVLFDRRNEVKEKAWNERLSWKVLNDITVLEC